MDPTKHNHQTQGPDPRLQKGRPGPGAILHRRVQKKGADAPADCGKAADKTKGTVSVVLAGIAS